MMQAGPELDALIAAKVMGWRVIRPTPSLTGGMAIWPNVHWQMPNGTSVFDLPNFSTSIAAAWEVVEKLGATLCFQIDNVGFGQEDQGKWRVMFGWSDDPVSVIADANTAPFAICLAALKAMEHK